MGQHLEDLQPETVQMSLQVLLPLQLIPIPLMLMQAFFSSLIVYYLSLGLTKVSILLQYQRVFTTKRFQLLCWGVMAIVIIYTIWTVFGSIFACIPVRAFWTKYALKHSAACQLLTQVKGACKVY
jgi:TctA family transporter